MRPTVRVGVNVVADDRLMTRQLIDIHGVAELLGVSERHIRRLVFERRIPFIKWGHLIRFDPAEIREWIDEYRRHPGRPA